MTPFFSVWNGLKRYFCPVFSTQNVQKKPLKHWILAVFQVWTWGESNPCPKAYSFRHLPLQSFYWGFPRRHAGWQACRFGSFIKSSISAKLWKRSAPHLFDARRIAAENYSADNAALRQRTLRNYRLRLNLGSRLMTRSRSPRMASQTSKPPSKPVQARAGSTDAFLWYGDANRSSPVQWKLSFNCRILYYSLSPYFLSRIFNTDF